MQLMTNNNKTMSSREIAELTGKRHADVMRDIAVMYNGLGIEQNANKHFDNTGFNGRKISYYQLNQELSLTLVSGYNLKLRNSIVKRWQELEVSQAIAIPQTYAAALLEAGRLAQELEEKSQLLSEAKPAIELHKSIVNDHGTLSMRDAGKQLQVKPNKFIEWLRDAKYLNYDNYAYQSKIDAGYMRLSTTEHNGKPRTNTRVTGKGFAHFGKKIAEIRFSNPDHLMFYRSTK
tara:strand:+ start:4702 stop:5400 length:699 start_codon:yes stop_codon:yes gene_type:complete